MNSRAVCAGRSTVATLFILVGAGAWLNQPGAEFCTLSPQHAGLAFPVENIDATWACRIKVVIDNHVTANTIGPLRTAMPESTYLYFLDRPPLAAALINRLDLADYKAETRGPNRWWGNDGEGTEGFVQLVYRDRTSRVYYLEGRHHSRLLPNMSGKAVVFLRMRPVQGDAMESTMVSYAMLDNRVLSGLVSLLRPLIGNTIIRKLAKGVDVVNRLGLEMRQHPDRVIFEATDPPPVAEDDVLFLKHALAGTPVSPLAGQSKSTKP